MPRPNLLYLHTHDTGRFLQPYGFDVPTPNLARLADQGVLYRDACCVSPTCSPSRAALLTGQTPHACGQLGLGNRGFPLAHPERLVVHPLRDAGYHSALLGVQHLMPDERDLGYDEVRPELIGHTVNGDNAAIDGASVATAAEAWLDAHAQDDRPWFLDAGIVQTHSHSWRMMTEAEAPDPGEGEGLFPPPLLPPGTLGRAHWAWHRRSAALADAAIGRILTALDRLGLAENTLVVYTTDHGLGVPRSKCRLTEAGLEVALIVRGPGFSGGRVDDRPVDHLDLAPTWLAAAGTSADWHTGRPLNAETRPGSGSEGDRLRFSEINHHNAAQPERSVRGPRFRLTRRWPAANVPAANTDDTPALAQLAALTPPPAPLRPPAGEPFAESLFDAAVDPLCNHDLSTDPAFAADRSRLSTALDAWMRDTADPLLTET